MIRNKEQLMNKKQRASRELELELENFILQEL